MVDVTSQLRRTSVSWYIAHPEAFADFRLPTTAEMAVTDLVFDITCAVAEDGTTFNLSDSDTDDTIRSVTSPVFHAQHFITQNARWPCFGMLTVPLQASSIRLCNGSCSPISRTTLSNVLVTKTTRPVRRLLLVTD